MEISAYKKEVIDKIKNFIKCQEEIIFSYIFGSFIEDETFNDVDIGIYVDKNITPIEKVFYEIKLSNQLEEIIKIPVDVIRLNLASDSILYRATKGILIKNIDDNIRTNFITMHWKKYWDFKDKIQEHVAEMKHGSR